MAQEKINGNQVDLTVPVDGSGLTNVNADLLADLTPSQLLRSDQSGTVTGNLTVTGTVNNRNMSMDGAKLDGLNATDYIQQVNAKGYTEAQYVLSGTLIDAANGPFQTKILTSSVTLTEAISNGQSIILQIQGGDSHAINWPTMSWVGGSAPTLTADDVVVLWKVGSVLYGSYVGSLV